MHTAYELHGGMFRLYRNGDRINADDLLACWSHSDRLAVIVTSPLGALGASFLMQLAMTAYFDVRPNRRGLLASHAEIFVIHVGGNFGNFGPLDIWPSRKELFIDCNADRLISEINNLGITHLVVPEGNRTPHIFPYKEPAAAFDRLRACFCYAQQGVLASGNIMIQVDDDAPLANVRAVIDPDLLFARAAGWRDDPDPARMSDRRMFMKSLEQRRSEVGEAERRQYAIGRKQLAAAGVVTEYYRSIGNEEALALLAAATRSQAERA